MEINIFGNKIMISKRILIIFICILIIVVGVIGYMINKKNAPIIIEKKPETNVNLKPTDGAQTGNVTVGEPPKNLPKEIKVYVVGCVNKPGVVTIKSGQILEEAIIEAGGLTDDADVENINLAYILRENVMLRIKSKKTAGPQTQSVKPAPVPTPHAETKGWEIIGDSAGTVVEENTSEKGDSGKKININTASINELDTLPGVGVETAKDIVSYREEKGGFAKTADIMNISGIKESKYNKLKDYIIAE